MKINPGKLTDYITVKEIVIENRNGTRYEAAVDVFGASCKFDEVWLRDIREAERTGTASELKILMFYDGRINNKMRVFRHSNGKEYKIKRILFDETNQNYMHVFVERVDDNV